MEGFDGNGGLTVVEVDGSDCGIRDSSNGVGEGLSGFVCTAADGVGEPMRPMEAMGASSIGRKWRRCQRCERVCR